MLKYYKVEYELYFGESHVTTVKDYMIAEPSDLYKTTKEKHITWENLDDSIETLEKIFWFVFTQNKKGRTLIFRTFSNSYVAKEWKTELNLTIRTEINERNASIEDILKYKNGDIAIKYLKERWKCNETL